jgi:hypothetical protein
MRYQPCRAGKVEPKVIALIVIGSLAVIILAYPLLKSAARPGVPKSDLTVAAMQETAYRVANAVREGNKPTTIDALPKLSSGLNRTKDGWGHALTLTVTSDAPLPRLDFEIRSAGEDGTPNTPDDIVINGSVDRDEEGGVSLLKSELIRPT